MNDICHLFSTAYVAIGFAGGVLVGTLICFVVDAIHQYRKGARNGR